MDKLVDVISGGFESFKHSAISKKIKLINNNAYSVMYSAKLDGNEVKGFIILTYRGSKNRLLALHFYAPSAKYDEFQPVLKQVMDSLKLS